MRAIFLIFVPVFLLAQDPDNVDRKKTESANVTAGKAQFAQVCGFCHGRDARGASGPDLIRSALVSHDVDGNLIGPIVHNGRPDKGMPAFQLPDAQIRNIAEFLHAQAAIASSVARKIPSDYPLEKLMIGNVEAGRTYFNGEGTCNSCHSTTGQAKPGDLAHIATKYKPFDLQTRIAFPEGAKPTVTVTDATGQTFNGEQVYSDEFLVALRDKVGWVHTWSRTNVQVKVDDPLAAHERLLKTYTDANIHDLFAYLETLK